MRLSTGHRFPAGLMVALLVSGALASCSHVDHPTHRFPPREPLPPSEQERIGYELIMSDGSTRQIVTRGQRVATLWIDGNRHDVSTFWSQGRPAIQIETDAMSQEVMIQARSRYASKVDLQLSPTVSAIRLFDASHVDLDASPGPTTLTAAPGGEAARTCGACGGTSVWVTNACTPCNGGWLCDKIKAPW